MGWLGEDAVVRNVCGIRTLTFKACFVRLFSGFIKWLIGSFISARYV